MVILRVHLLRGRSDELKRRLLHELTEQTAAILGIDRQRVRVFIVELEPENWGIAGVPVSLIRGQALPDSRQPMNKT